MNEKVRTREHVSAVEAFLLQKYRALFIWLIAIKISSRLILLAVALFLVLAHSLSSAQVLPFLYGTPLFALIWYLEQQSLSSQLASIEVSLARQAGGEWEDFYIKSKYTLSRRMSLLGKLEPILWLVLIISLGYIRIRQQAP
jgi:hypothetical protein